ncbi:MAG TPA: hypothetical protein PKD16_18285 [Saprospiraceae bacterium]|jgi:hypothetical protein|nr:hypothetical protein [Saprospiraceae bacterium]HMT72124.1 hypothetical protein [Saprospiraceae bacterium]
MELKNEYDHEVLKSMNPKVVDKYEPSTIKIKYLHEVIQLMLRANSIQDFQNTVDDAKEIIKHLCSRVEQ